jgi:hypothetical protein
MQIRVRVADDPGAVGKPHSVNGRSRRRCEFSSFVAPQKCEELPCGQLGDQLSLSCHPLGGPGGASRGPLFGPLTILAMEAGAPICSRALTQIYRRRMGI